MTKGHWVLAATVAITGAVVFVVHSSQKQERERMFGGVIRDLERQKWKQEQQQQQKATSMETRK